MNVKMFYADAKYAYREYGVSGMIGVMRHAVVRRWPAIEYVPVQPLRIQVEVTSRCNLKCIMCARTHHIQGKGEHMAMDTFRRTIREFRSAREVHLQGWGEPFLHPDIFTMIELANPRRRVVSVNSNLTVIDEKIARKIFASNLSILRLSLDGISPQTYEKFRPPSKFERVVNNLIMLSTVRREMGNSKTRVVLVVVCQQGNIEELPEFVHFAADVGIDELRVQEVREFGSTADTQSPDPTSLRKTKELCYQRARDCGVQLDWSFYSEYAGTFCKIPWNWLYIRANGKISLCCEKFFAETDEDTFGDINVQTGRQIWNGAKYRSARAKLAKGSYPTSCRLCPIYKYPDVQVGQTYIPLMRE